MDFHKNQLFHIYNQGNNQRQIFYSKDNYEFFLWKMRAYLLPFGELIAWCLMPNHFHWQFFVKKIAIQRKELWQHTDQLEYQRRQIKFGEKAVIVNRSTHRTADKNSLISLNNAIGTLQKSYTDALNKEKGWSGSLFRKKCKAKNGWIDDFITVSQNDDKDDLFRSRVDYEFQCFQYIHNNPVEANLVKQPTDYSWSSAKDYAGLRKGSLCNLEMGRQLRDFI